MKGLKLTSLLALALLFVGLNAATVQAQEQKIVETPENLAKVEYNDALAAVKAGDLAKALTHVNKGIQLDASNAKLHYVKAFVIRKQGDMEASIDLYLKAEEVAKTGGDTDIAQKARAAAAQGYVTLAAQALQENDGRAAITHLDKATEMGESDADTHYYYAKAYNLTGNHQTAAQHAQQAVELEKGGASQKAKSYFELGVAHKRLGNMDQAKAAFQQAATGSFRAAAEYELKFLGTSGGN